MTEIAAISFCVLSFLIGFIVGLELRKQRIYDGKLILDNTDPDVDKIELMLDVDPEQVDVYILKVEKTRHKTGL